MSKKVFYDADARRRVLGGAELLYNAVKTTMGPKGRNVVIDKSYFCSTQYALACVCIIKYFFRHLDFSFVEISFHYSLIIFHLFSICHCSGLVNEAWQIIGKCETVNC